jgi:[ribosomal protein S5]-alanine N-acetyltransferase
VGAIGVKINPHKTWGGEIGYFISEQYWGEGIATIAVKIFSEYCFKELKLHRLELIIDPRNKASEKVALKNKYAKEGLLKSNLYGRDNKWHDNLLYAKINLDESY